MDGLLKNCDIISHRNKTDPSARFAGLRLDVHQRLHSQPINKGMSCVSADAVSPRSNQGEETMTMQNVATPTPPQPPPENRRGDQAALHHRRKTASHKNFHRSRSAMGWTEWSRTPRGWVVVEPFISGSTRGLMGLCRRQPAKPMDTQGFQE